MKIPAQILANIPNLKLRARLVVESLFTGLHRSKYQGFNLEFAEYREYIPGDDLRHLDWKVLARKNRLYIKKYQEDTTSSVMVALDCSESMNFDGKFEYARVFAAALLYLVIAQGDQAGLVLFSNEIKTLIPPRRGKSQINPLLETLEEAKPSGTAHWETLVRRISGKKRHLFVFISDFLPPGTSEIDFKLIKQLRSMKNEVSLIQILSPAELEPPFQEDYIIVDAETEQKIRVDKDTLDFYRQAIGDYTKKLKLEMSKADINFFLTTTEIPIEKSFVEFVKSKK